MIYSVISDELSGTELRMLKRRLVITSVENLFSAPAPSQFHIIMPFHPVGMHDSPARRTTLFAIQWHPRIYQCKLVPAM